jgi:hypothetical protein
MAADPGAPSGDSNRSAKRQQQKKTHRRQNIGLLAQRSQASSYRIKQGILSRVVGDKYRNKTKHVRPALLATRKMNILIPKMGRYV